MMKLQIFLLSTLFTLSHLMSASVNQGVYYGELKALKARPDSKMIFDKDADGDLRKIHRDIPIYKNLSFFHQLIRRGCLGFDVIIVTYDTMPSLYGYIESICKLANVAVPTIFITRKEVFFNAFAQKLLMSTGAFVIGQKLLKESSDQEVEAIVAHEIGHIKYNHINKRVALGLINMVLFYKLIRYLSREGDYATYTIDYPLLSHIPLRGVEISRLGKIPVLGVTVHSIKFSVATVQYWLKHFGIAGGLFIIKQLIENKRFEKQADEFACKVAGKSAGIIEFFEHYKQREQQRDDEFSTTYNVIKQNKAFLSHFYYSRLLLRYYGAKTVHSVKKAIEYVFAHTFLGSHPSHQSRIDAAEKYLAQQQA